MLPLPTDEELIDKLVTKWHLSVPERRSLPGGMARGSLIRAAIARHAIEDGWFPKDWRPDVGYHGGALEVLPKGCQIHWKAESGVGKFALLRVSYHADIGEAAEQLVRGMYGNNIDGIAVDWDS